MAKYNPFDWINRQMNLPGFQVRGRTVTVPVEVLVALLRAVGGRIILDRYDLTEMNLDSINAPELLFYETGHPPGQMVIELKEHV